MERQGKKRRGGGKRNGGWENMEGRGEEPAGRKENRKSNSERIGGGTSGTKEE